MMLESPRLRRLLDRAMADAGVRTAFIALVLACVACHPARRHADPEPPATPAVAEPRTAVVDTGLPPLTNAPWLDRLDLEGGATAFVSVPLGAKEPRPIMVAAHGAGDRPEWACGAWRGVTQAYPFIICPRGTPTGDGRYYWSSTAELARVVDRAIVALRERFGAYVAPGPMLYAGFSAGAIYGAAFVRDRAADFPVILFAEGGYDQVADPRFAAQFKKNGGRRALLGCSTGAGCLGRFRQAAKVFERAGVRTRVNDAGFIGHNLRDEVVQSLRKDLPWLVSDAVGWPSAGSVTVPAPVSSTDAATTATHASTTAAPPDESPVGVVGIDVPNDLPVFFARGAKDAPARIVFLSGMCTHPGGYLQSFQYAAHARGSMLGLQGDVSCGGDYRRWSFDLARQNARIEAGFAAAGEPEPGQLKDVVLIGYSQGARLAEGLAHAYPERYTRVILIGDPADPSAARLATVRAAVMMAGELDAKAHMKSAARALTASGVPTTYLEMPGARHGQMGDAERLMGAALDWVLGDGGRSNAPAL